MKKVLRFITAWIVANILIWLGFVKRAKAATFRGEHILSIYFHKPSLKEFESCIKWLKKHHFRFLSTDDLCQIIDHNLPLPSGAVLLTVDDGWQSNKPNIVDIAEKHQVPVTIFVATEPVEHGVYWWSVIEEANSKGMISVQVEHLKKVPNQERLSLVNSLIGKLTLTRQALTVQQIEQLAVSPWITLGAHTDTHPILNNCSEEQVYFEVATSREKLQKWTGHSVDYFAYPNGDYSEREVRIMNEAGFKLAFSVRTLYLTKDRMQQRYELPRFEVIENAPFAETICRMTGVWEPFMYKARHLFRFRSNKAKPATPAKLDSQTLVNV